MNLNDPRPAHKLVKLLGSRETAINVGIIHPQTPAYYVDVALSRPVNADMNSDCLTNNHRLLLDQFEDLVYLLEFHDFRISLNDYDRLSKSSIAIELMNRVAAVELLQQAIDVHVLPYIQKHGLSKDDVMADYAAELMEKCKISEMASSSTEPRVILILSNIASVDVRLNVLVHLLRQTAVPWSVAIDELLSSVDSFKSAQSFGELVELKKLMELKRTLYRYNVTSLNISDLSMANGIYALLLCLNVN
jgi:hypothetical protein